MSKQHDRLIALLESDGPRLHALLLRLTLRSDLSEELLQELFLRLARSAGFAGAQNAFAYARRVAINLAMEARRSRPGNAGELDEVIVRESRSPLDGLIESEQVEQILDGLSDLPELSRECFVLRFIEGESYESIGSRIGKTPHQARGLCHAAVREIRKKLALKTSDQDV